MRILAAFASVLLVVGETTSPSALQAQETSGKRADTPAKAKPDQFALLRPFEGHWRGEGNGQPGQSTVERSYEFVLRGKYLNVRNSSVYAPQAKNPKGEKHEDWGMFSYDANRKKLVLRQFHVEGFVNQYVLDRSSDDDKELIFVSETIENIPAGYRARETYRFTDPNTFEETFELAPPGKDFEVYVKTKFTKAK
ncbi:MAG TPA: hypothetical protein VKE98_01815 [Gemmataceae bacterium]|nr:hypothetical protein [Gemmataceae bacterium]